LFFMIWYEHDNNQISGEILVETNSSSAPDDSFVVESPEPMVWYKLAQAATWENTNPFTADITAFYFTVSSGADSPGKIHILAVQDATP